MSFNVQARCRYCNAPVEIFGEVCAVCVMAAHRSHELDGPVSPECVNCGAADLGWNLPVPCPARER
jgi:hypothetical protein